MRDYHRWQSETIRDGAASKDLPSEIVSDGRARASETMLDGEAGTIKNYESWIGETITDGDAS